MKVKIYNRVKVKYWGKEGGVTMSTINYSILKISIVSSDGV